MPDTRRWPDDGTLIEPLDDGRYRVTTTLRGEVTERARTVTQTTEVTDGSR